VNVLIVLFIGLATNVVCQFTGYITLDTSAQQMPLIFVAILLVFRTGYAYGRFMEGRGHVGSMVFNVRDLARKMVTFVNGDDPQTNFDKQNTVRLLRAFTVANRLSCRAEEQTGFTELESFLTSSEAARLKEIKKNYPVQILQWVGKSLTKFKDKQMFGRALDSMEEQVGELMGAWMGMQKLATTPFPFPYAQMCTFFLYLWCYTCPSQWPSATSGMEPSSQVLSPSPCSASTVSPWSWRTPSALRPTILSWSSLSLPAKGPAKPCCPPDSAPTKLSPHQAKSIQDP